jgi:hypothetical protein
MTAIDLARIPYQYRFNGASLLIAKANRLANGASGSTETKHKQSLAAVAYFDMALLLMKPYDPNYATIVNWRNVKDDMGRTSEARDARLSVP